MILPLSSTLLPDDEERELALNPQQSFIVQAPAGSGKTELLIQRFLTLLQYVKTPEEILAITFTKKAANEMRTRVISALKKAADGEVVEAANTTKTAAIALRVLARDKALGWDLLQNPNRLHIQTIDALCVYLTKSLPLLSGFGSQPTLTDFPQNLYHKAVEIVLSHLEDHDLAWANDIANLLLHLDNDINKLHDLLVNLLLKRDQWMQYIHLDVDNDTIKAELERHLKLNLCEKLCVVKQAIPQSSINELLAIIRFAAADTADSKIICCRNLCELPGSSIQDLPLWQAIATFLITKQYEWRKKPTKDIGFANQASLKSPQEIAINKAYRERYANLLMHLQDNATLRHLLKQILTLPEPSYKPKQWRILKSLFQVLKIVLAQLRIVFVQHGQIDFIENVQAALLALGTDEKPTDLLLALDYTISHILIDEFQDTSSTQFHLLEKLIMGWEENDGRTLFVVGDPMQSIYRFREAEVGLFIRMREIGLGNLKLKPLMLTTNFRSSSQIVDWNNHHFQNIFPAHDDIATGAVSYSVSLAKNSSAVESTIHIKGFITSSDNDQANTIVDTIREKQQQFPHEKIAILVRARSHLSAIIPALKKAHIPFQAVDIDPLAARQHIQDLLALTCGLLHLADRIAWLAILRAPWCGVTLSDLYIIAGSERTVTLWQQLLKPEIISQLSADGQLRISKLITILKTQFSNRYRVDLRTWIETTWQILGGPATLENEAEIDDANAYFALLTQLQQDNMTLNVDILKEKIDSFYASTGQDANTSLQIMTIHSAKGLEFDSVILPHLERKLPKDDKTLLNWMEQPLDNDQTALLIAPASPTDDDKDPLYEYIHQQKMLKLDYETDRLFYVATTRAKTSLYLFYNLTLDDHGEAKISNNSFLQKIWPFIANQSQLENVYPKEVNANDKDKTTQHHYIKRLKSSWENKIIKLPTQKIFYHQQQGGFKLINPEPKIIGIIVHQILQIIAKFGVAWWHDQTSAVQRLYLQQMLTQAGILSRSLKDATNRTLHIIENCMQDSRGRWILQQHLDAHSEYALSALIDHEIKNFIIDRTFVDSDGIRWIIDFKTSTFTSGELETFLQFEYEKYKEKMHHYYRTFKLIDEHHPIHLGLYFPAIPAWKAWLPD